MARAIDTPNSKSVKRDLVTWRTCTVGACQNKSRTRLGQLCETHYYRRRRTGTFDDPIYGRQCTSNHGYVVGYQPDHPLAGKSGVLYEHRRVLFEKIGPGIHPCHWCARPIEWKARGRERLVADHMDGNKQRNVDDNLVPSCHRCNATRGLFIRWVMEHRNDAFLHALFSQALIAHDGRPLDPTHPWAQGASE